MREIKFRAWDKNENSKAGMQSVSEIDFVSEQAHLGDREAGWWRTFEECVLMQFTGLKDKNGKEIYEGDIVEHRDGQGNPDWRYEVCYTWARFQLKGNRHNLSEVYNVCEIIGNIYENPKLLQS